MISHTLTSIALLLLSNQALADLTCQPYTLQSNSSTSTTGVINFTGQNGESNIPSTNATSASPIFLDTSEATPGTVFTFQLCQSTSLNIGVEEFTPPLSSPGPGCQSTFFNPVHVIDPSTGNCLTRRSSASNPGHLEIFLKACNPNPTTKAQFFQIIQTTYYAQCDAPTGYGPLGFFPWGFDESNQYANPESPWVIAGDGRTVLFNPVQQKPVRDSLVGVVVGVGR